jgi:aspartyl aminopeptidase
MMLKRIALAQSGTEEAFYQAVERAFMISADNAHAWHPNYIICSALCGAKITINYEIAKKNRRKVLKNRNIYRFSFEFQNNYVILQRI